MITADDLDLVETDELVAALQRRFDTSVFVGLKDWDGDHDDRYLNWRGNRHVALGLVAVVMHKIAVVVADDLEDSDDQQEDDDE